MNLWENIKIWLTSLFGDSPIVKLGGGIDLVIENKEVLVRGETTNAIYMDESAFIESPKKKAEKVTKKKEK